MSTTPIVASIQRARCSDRAISERTGAAVVMGPLFTGAVFIMPPHGSEVARSHGGERPAIAAGTASIATSIQ
ncbi:hypothetical protein GCM10025774_25230 [Microbacterium kyungheense]